MVVRFIRKNLCRFTLQNVIGNCKKGIALANIKNPALGNIKVTGFEDPLVSIHNVIGNGLNGAAKLDAPKLPDLIAAPAEKYKLQ